MVAPASTLLAGRQLTNPSTSDAWPVAKSAPQGSWQRGSSHGPRAAAAGGLADDCFSRHHASRLATASATYEWPGRTGVARLLGDERTRQREPSQTIALRGRERPLNLGMSDAASPRSSSSGGCLERGYRAPRMNLDVDTSGDRSMVDRARRGSGVGKGEVKGAKQTWSCLTFGDENHGTAVSAGSPPRHPRPAGRAPRWQGCRRSLGLGGPSWAGEGDVCSHRSFDGRYFTAAGARGRRGLR
jgi:hypothetical protein